MRASFLDIASLDARRGVTPRPGAWLLFDIEVFKAEPETPVAFNTPSLVGGLFALLIVIYYCFIFDPSPDGQEL